MTTADEVGVPDPDDAEQVLQRTVADADGPAPVDAEPAEEGPRRRLLVVLAAVAGAVLLWFLFRSVPGETGGVEGSAGDGPSEAASVERMVNESDPSWMQNADTARRVGGAPESLVPPVYGPAGSGAADYQGVRDSTGVPGTAAPGTAEGAPEQAAADRRREAFYAALRSRPVLGTAGSGMSGSEAAVTDGEPIPLPPTLAEMDSAAQVEADRRTMPAGPGGFSVDPAASGVMDAATPPARASRSSYVTGGGNLPAQAPPQVTTARVAGPPSGRVVIPVGTIIDGQLHTAVSSDLPGHVVGTVTRNVYDATQRVVVIPRHSWLFGTYESDVATGQARLVVQWTSVRFPSGETYELPALRASDRSGASGLQGRVNNHYGRIFGQALLSSVVAAGFQVGTDADDSDERRSAGSEMATATAQQLGQTATEVTRRNLGIKPTITVPRLTRFSIIVDRDLVFAVPGSR